MGSQLGKSDIEKLKEKKDVKGLIKALKYDDSNIRMLAANSLGKIGDERAVASLTQALKDEGYGVLNEVLKALVKIGDPAVETLIKALSDEKLEDGAKVALIKIGEPASRNLMFKYYNQDKNTQISYIDIMGEIGDKNSVEHLIHILEEVKKRETYNRDILTSTIKALGKSGDEKAIAIINDLYFKFCRIQSDRYLTELFMDVITSVDKTGSDFLVQELTSNNVYVREKATEALFKMDDQMAVNSLIYALKDKNGDIFRKRAAVILCRIGEPAVIPLIQALKDENRNLRFGAADLLGEIGDERAIEPLIQALKDKDSYVRLEAAEALDKIGWKPRDGQENVYYLIAKAKWKDVVKIGKPAVNPLIQALHDGELDLRYEATEVLGEIGDERAVEPLTEALKDRDVDVRIKAAEVLSNMSSLGHQK
jgi:HEAT repeat protein